MVVVLHLRQFCAQSYMVCVIGLLSSVRIPWGTLAPWLLWNCDWNWRQFEEPKERQPLHDFCPFLEKSVVYDSLYTQWLQPVMLRSFFFATLFLNLVVKHLKIRNISHMQAFPKASQQFHVSNISLSICSNFQKGASLEKLSITALDFARSSQTNRFLIVVVLYWLTRLGSFNVRQPTYFRLQIQKMILF